MSFFEDIKQRLFLDGAMGTMLQSLGLRPGEATASWNFSYPKKVQSVHEAYLQAGCNVISANTFTANRFHFPEPGKAAEVAEKGVLIAKEAVKQHTAQAYVALDVGPLGKLLEPFGPLPFEEAYEAFREIVIAGARAGADFVLLETMNDLTEIKAAVLAVKENTDLPLAATMTFDHRMRLLTGGDLHSMVAMLEGLGADAIGFNCSLGPKEMIELLREARKISSRPLICTPNAGLPVTKNGETTYLVTPDEFAQDMAAMAREGAFILGGCCGTTPAHIKAMVKRCGEIPLPVLTDLELTVASSYNHAVYFGDRPLVIGERLNPAGRPQLQQALREKDYDSFQEDASDQEDEGADLLDVNAGISGIDEAEALTQTVVSVQTASGLPLMLDTANAKAMEAAARRYSGKPVLNSVNGTRESMDRIFPIAKRYGGLVVCLPFDESGIPSTAKGRLEIAEKIIQTATEYGIAKKDMLFDPIVTAIGTGETELSVMMDTALELKQWGYHTVFGVSNISYGLPARENINAAMLTAALLWGADACFADPASQRIMAIFDSVDVLTGKDRGGFAYTQKYAGAEAFDENEKKDSLVEAILRGNDAVAETAAKKLLERKSFLEIIDGEVTDALNLVGEQYEKGELFLPQLLKSAETTSLILKAIRPAGEEKHQKGPVVLATVKDDVHDIGKNVVKILLENYGFSVIDLGKNVDASRIADTVEKNGAKLLGLSALMTTTLPSMKETIALVKSRCPQCRIMVGGAVLTEETARLLGADFYGKDAVSSAKYAQELLGGR